MLRAAVIGAGRIGAGLDEPGGAAPITHAGAYAAHADFRLAALCDADPATAAREAGRWGCAAYGDPREMLRAERPDVVSVCTPTALHAETLWAILESAPLAVVAEKPLTESVEHTREVAAAFEAAGVPLIVHFTRRFIPLYREVRARVLSGARVLSASMKYAKGLGHNGAHAMDLALFLFGEVRAMRPLAVRGDFFEGDPTVAAHLSCERCADVHFQALDERAFTHFEFDVILDDGRWTFYRDDFAALRYEVADNPRYRCKGLVPAGEVRTGKERAMLELAAHAAAVAEGRVEPACTAREALRGQELCVELAAMAREGAA